MMQGIGIDIIEVSRIQSNILKHGQNFLDKVFTQEEQAYCKSFRQSGRNFAGRFAAKEAVVKALGCGFAQGISWLDIEIRNDSQGKPYLILSDILNTLYQNPTLHISISHCHEYATAVAYWEVN